MARYERDYGRDFGRWGPSGGQPRGGMRSDGWGGSGDWREFPGEEGWLGEGYAGMPNFGYDVGFRGEERGGLYGEGYGTRFGGGLQGADFPHGGGEFGRRAGGYGGRGWETGYGGRDIGYAEGWEDQRGTRRLGGHFGERTRTRAAEIMTENPHAVTPDVTLAEAAKKMRDLDVGIIPVVESAEDRRLRGVITDRDIAVRAVAEGKDSNTSVGDCMTDHVRAVNKNDSVRDVMRIMRQEQVRRVPVTDREGRLVGIIAQADLAVDYASDDPSREMEIGETIERISEPAEPRRGGSRLAASAE